jgi:hypothetical protein
MQSDSVDMVEATRQALQDLRAALIEMYAAIGADPTTPQDVARRFGLNRLLTWKLSRVINAPEPIATLKHLPGQQGLELVIDAFRKEGASEEAAIQVLAAFVQFTEVVKRHAGDREQLELMLESMGLLEREGQANSFRELAYRGNSAVWGVQARTRGAISFFAPSASAPDTIDSVGIGAYVGLRRLRPGATGYLFRQRSIENATSIDIEPFDATCPESDRKFVPQLLPEFCSPNMPALSFQASPGGREALMPDGPVGNVAAFDFVYGFRSRYSAHRTTGSDFGRSGIAITIPVEMLVLHIVFHHTLATSDMFEAILHGSPERFRRGATMPRDQHDRDRLPMTERPLQLAGTPPALSTPLFPALTRIADRVYKRMGWNPEEFRGVRLQLPYPPVSTYVMMRWPLPEKTS